MVAKPGRELTPRDRDPQAEKQDTSGLLERENTVSSRKASARTAGDGKLQSGTFMCERG